MKGRRIGLALLLVLPGGLGPAAGQDVGPFTASYEVDLNDRADDRFKVTVHLRGLTPGDTLFQFAATAPGTYQVMDIGRFVTDFRVLDADGRRLAAERRGVNQWRLTAPEQARTIRYAVAETWDTPVAEDPVYLMAGTSLERDHAFVSPHAVFGFPAARKDDPVRVRFQYPMEWKVGTALVRDADWWYAAEDYDQLIDSPFLLGRLTSATVPLDDVPVDIWVYSKRDVVRADHLRDAMTAMLTAAGRFLEGLPVDRYAFLWHFETVTQGAWEHSRSSQYVMAEPRRWTADVGRGLTDIAAHEFFHVVTPLNIHSEIIADFDFQRPRPSRHLWLYEGVTEWASDIMQLRTRLIGLEEYLRRMAGKIVADRRFYDPDYSLVQLALESYTPRGQAQFANIYERGAVVAALLDIRLLELSGGTRGLRELVLDLEDRYGPDRPFEDATFFDTLAAFTHPEIRDFLRRYVEGAEPLPLSEYFGKIGIEFLDGPEPRFELDLQAGAEATELRRAWLRLRPDASQSPPPARSPVP